MKFKTRELIKELEANIKNSYSFPIFKGYKAINKRGVEKLIDELYANLPEDVQRAREFLQNRQYNLDDIYPKTGSRIYDLLKIFETFLDQSATFSISFSKIVILNVRELEILLNRLEDEIPSEIKKAEIIDK